jgi:hypothetical protein
MKRFLLLVALLWGSLASAQPYVGTYPLAKFPFVGNETLFGSQGTGAIPPTVTFTMPEIAQYITSAAGPVPTLMAGYCLSNDGTNLIWVICGSGTGITQLTGDVRAGPGIGSQAATVVAVNGGAVPLSAAALASNSLGQLISATAVPLFSGSFTLNDCVKIGVTSPLTIADAGAACGSGGGGGGGTVTSVSVVSANGLSGSVANPTSTPAITLEPTFTGIAYSNGSGFAAAVAGEFPILNQSTTGNAATATEFQSAPAGCTGTTYATGIGQSGIANCSQITSVNGASIPASANLTGTNGSSQFVAVSIGAGLSLSSSIIAQTRQINAQTGTTYTFVSSDNKKLVTFNNSSAIAVSLAQATGSFGAGWSVVVQDLGAGTATITPTTSTINGVSTLAIPQNQGCTITSDGTNYQVSDCTALTVTVTTFDKIGSGDNTTMTATCDTGCSLSSINSGVIAASTAVQLATSPAGCTGGQFSTGINAFGVSNCSTPTGAGTVNSGSTGNAAYYGANGTAVSPLVVGTNTLLGGIGSGVAALTPAQAIGVLNSGTPDAQTGTTYTLVLSDANVQVTMSNASANTLTIPANASVAFPIGTLISVQQLGSGTTSIALAAGVTINQPGNLSYSSLAGQFGFIQLIQTATNVWNVVAFSPGSVKFTVSGGTCTDSATSGGNQGGTITMSSVGGCTLIVTPGGGLVAKNMWVGSMADQTQPTIPAWKQTAQSTTTITFTVPAAVASTDVVTFDIHPE